MEIAEATKKFNLPYNTVKSMAAKIGPEFAKVRNESKDRIGDLLADLVEANVEGMKAIAKQATDVSYTKKHNPTSLSDLYEKLANTTVRLLEAAGGVVAEAQQEEA
jgi:hypothetical protein